VPLPPDSVHAEIVHISTRRWSAAIFTIERPFSTSGVRWAPRPPLDLHSIAGHPSRDTTPAALITLALVVHLFRPAVKRSVRAIEEAGRNVVAEAHKIGDAIGRFGI
jgi:hypothetical protein